jgi:pimeloyl-ACP methyl ester carboxylesterase
VIGEHNLPDFHAIAAILRQHIPNANRLDVAGVGHVFPMEAPGRFNEIGLGFLAEK